MKNINLLVTVFQLRKKEWLLKENIRKATVMRRYQEVEVLKEELADIKIQIVKLKTILYRL